MLFLLLRSTGPGSFIYDPSLQSPTCHPSFKLPKLHLTNLTDKHTLYDRGYSIS